METWEDNNKLENEELTEECAMIPIDGDTGRILISIKHGSEITIRIKWGEQTRSPTEAGRNPKEEAMEFLREKLAGGAIEANEMMMLLSKAKISARTANRAKKELGIISVRKNGKSYWMFPE